MSNNRQSDEEERWDEERTVLHILNVIQEKVETSHHLEDMLMDHEEDHAAEHDLFMKVNEMGLNEGMIAGGVTFLSLLTGPYIVKTLRSTRTYKLDTPKPQGSKAGTLALIGIRLGFQVAASLVIAAYTTDYFTDEEQMLQAASSAPLLEGRSVIADEFCISLSREYYRMHSEEYWNQVKDPYLVHMGKFVENCQKRYAYERQLRNEHGLSRDAPISIPSPGVPPDYPVDRDSYLQALNMADQDDGFRLNNFEESAEWAEALVTDQEMDPKRD